MRVRRLGMLLSGLLPHPCDSVELEQYTTDGDLAARWLADISAFGDLTEGCTVAVEAPNWNTRQTPAAVATEDR